MRATISFDIDVDEVEDTMGMLVAQEADTLRAVADMIDVQPGPRTMVLEEVTEALRLLQETSTQLQQYKEMLISFEQAKYSTILPQSCAESPINVVPETTTPATAARALPNVGEMVRNLTELQTSLSAMTEFGSFVDKINHSEEESGEHNEPQTQEG